MRPFGFAGCFTGAEDDGGVEPRAALARVVRVLIVVGKQVSPVIWECDSDYGVGIQQTLGFNEYKQINSFPARAPHPHCCLASSAVYSSRRDL